MRTSTPWILGLAGVLTVGAFAAGVASRADEWRVTVRGTGVDLGETPIVTEVPSAVASGPYHLRPVSGGDSIDAQAFDHGQVRFLAFILPQVTASQPTLFSLESRAQKDVDPGKGLAVRPHAANLIVNLDGKLLSEYRLDSGSKPIFFPLIGPTGDSYTRAYPTENVPGEQHDHPHQRSCWFTHGKVNGVDFWAEGAKCGNIKETSRDILAEGPVLARLATTDDWLTPDGRRVCADVRTVTFYRSLQSRIIDFEFTIRATDGPLTFGETKEGMFGLRVASSMDVNKKTGGQITNAEGTDRRQSLGQALSLGGLRRARKRQNGGRRRAQSPLELPLSHCLARAALRSVCRQSLRRARVWWVLPRGTHGPARRDDVVPLSRHPPRWRNPSGPCRSLIRCVCESAGRRSHEEVIRSKAADHARLAGEASYQFSGARITHLPVSLLAWARKTHGQKYLRPNAVEVLLRTRSSSGNLRHARNKVPRCRYRSPSGLALVRQKDHFLSNMAEAAPG